MERVAVDIPEDGFIYFIDEHKTVALPGNVFNNMTVDYEKLLVQGFHERLKNATGDDEYGRQIGLMAEGLEKVFTDDDDERDAARILENLQVLMQGKAVQIAKDVLGPKGITSIKNLIKKNVVKGKRSLRIHNVYISKNLKDRKKKSCGLYLVRIL